MEQGFLQTESYLEASLVYTPVFFKLEKGSSEDRKCH